MVSDSADDYLYLYANADCVYTDRVHACVPTISFGNPCKFYYSTPRTLLFERIGIENTKSMMYPDTHRIETEKKKQVEFLSDILK